MKNQTVVETITVGKKVWIDSRETSFDESCAIYVEATPEARSVSEYDMIRWEGKTAYWTPKGRDGQIVGPIDVKLNCKGSSGVKRPEVEKAKK